MIPLLTVSFKLRTRSTIIDRSSMTLSPDNPFDDRLRTPTKSRVPVCDKATPTSLVRNLFARNRSACITPTKSPSERPPYPPPTTVVLPPSRKSLGQWSPSPEDDDVFEREESPTPVRGKPNGHGRPGLLVDVNPKLEDLDVKPIQPLDLALPPPQQSNPKHSVSTASDGHGSGQSNVNSKRQAPSPTLRNDPLLPTAIPTSDAGEGDPFEEPVRVKKRVRLASPAASRKANGHVNTQSTPVSSSETLKSAPSVPTDGSSSKLPPTLSSSAWQLRLAPPLARDIANSMEFIGIPTVVYQDPYYSNPSDVPPRAKMFAGRMFTLKGSTTCDLPDFEFSIPGSRKWLKTKRFAPGRASYGWEYGIPPPSTKKVLELCIKEDAEALALC